MSHSYILNFTQGNACSLCQEKLSGAMTMAICGHIFHERCARTLRNDLCPCCQKLIDEPTEEDTDKAGAPLLPRGTLVMLQGLTVQWELNGTYAEIIEYLGDVDRYCLRHDMSSFIYRAKPKNVVNITID